MKVTVGVGIGLLLLAGSADAALLEAVGKSAKVIEASDQTVSIPSVVKLSIPGKARPPVTELKLAGAGIRTKKIVLIKVKAYVAASFLENPALVNRADPMPGITKNRVRALRLTFLRDISADKIRSAFSDSLKANGANLESPLISDTLGKLAVDMPEKGTLTLVGFAKDATTEVLVAETPKGTHTIEGPGISTQFWKIWFGVPADSGIESLREELLGSPAS